MRGQFLWLIPPFWALVTFLLRRMVTASGLGRRALFGASVAAVAVVLRALLSLVADGQLWDKVGTLRLWQFEAGLLILLAVLIATYWMRTGGQRADRKRPTA